MTNATMMLGLAALLLSTTAHAQYFNQPVNPTMADCDELHRQYRLLANQTVDEGFAGCDALSLSDAHVCQQEVLREQRTILDEGGRAAEACRMEARDEAAAARNVAQRIAEAYDQYQQIREIAENPVRFFQRSLSDYYFRSLTMDAGFGRIVTPEGRAIYDHVVRAAEYGSRGFVNPMISSYNEELLEYLIPIFRDMIDQMADLEAEIAELKASQ
jgi:hypothetical protein